MQSLLRICRALARAALLQSSQDSPEDVTTVGLTNHSWIGRDPVSHSDYVFTDEDGTETELFDKDITQMVVKICELEETPELGERTMPEVALGKLQLRITQLGLILRGFQVLLPCSWSSFERLLVCSAVALGHFQALLLSRGRARL